MIRWFFVTFSCLLLVTACATGKAVKTTTVYAPSEFQITDINVDVPVEISNRAELRRLMTYASTNLALQYNEIASLVSPEYVMEISLQSYKPSPRSEAVMRYRVILRNPDDGIEYRALPVAYGALDGGITEQNTEKRLIGGSLPEAFYRLYGLSDTPPVIEANLSEEGLFADPASQESTGAVNYYPSDIVSVPPTPAGVDTGGGPKVISCAVC
ncbi:MAG: hypothetical protein ACR2O3_10250 [Rhizobiaceae bacterium]